MAAPKVLISDELSPAAVQIFRDRGVDVTFLLVGATVLAAVTPMIGALLDAIDMPQADGWATLTLQVPAVTRMASSV